MINVLSLSHNKDTADSRAYNVSPLDSHDTCTYI